MAHPNLKTKKKKEYNPNPRDAFGTTKAEGFWYNAEGRNVTPSHPQTEQYDPTKIYFYEVGANDGSYRKCTSEEDALMRFAQLVEFEKRQTEIR